MGGGGVDAAVNRDAESINNAAETAVVNAQLTKRSQQDSFTQLLALGKAIAYLNQPL